MKFIFKSEYYVFCNPPKNVLIAHHSKRFDKMPARNQINLCLLVRHEKRTIDGQPIFANRPEFRYLDKNEKTKTK